MVRTLHPPHHNHQNENEQRPPPPNHQQRINRQLTMSNFQDGKPASKSIDHSSGLFRLSKLMDRTQKELHSETTMNTVRHHVGLYQNYPLANGILSKASKREAAFQKSGTKQLNHVRGTEGWWLSMLVIEDRAIDNFLGPWIVIIINAIMAVIFNDVLEWDMPQDALQHWDTVYSLVLKTSLAFLLVFRLNRCAVRFWEARGLWGNLTHNTRNLVGGLLLYGGHAPKHRNLAIRWASAFCVATMHFIRSDHSYAPDELAGFLTVDQVSQLQDANHAPLYAASMVRHYLRKLFPIDETTPPGLAHAHAIQLQHLEDLVRDMVSQVSGMEKIRSTPLPIAYVSHLRTFLFAYCMFLPYIWVTEWSWATIPLVACTAFALLGIEGASSEVEIPFDRSRPNHLALDAYCLVILDSVLGLVVQDANMHMQGRKSGQHSSRRMGVHVEDTDDEYEDEDDAEDEGDSGSFIEGRIETA